MSKYTIGFFVAVLFFAPFGASAATISFETIPAHAGVGDTVRVNVLISSAIPANAFSGSVDYSPTQLELVAVSDGNSIVSLWVTHPALATSSATIPFAGITPGGFSGTNGTLFSILFRVKAAGTASIRVTNPEVLRNDGKGGEEPVTATALSVAFAAKSLGSYAEPVDTSSPEVFTAALGTDPELFDGHSYIVFSTVDKDSGIDHYEITETRVPTFLKSLFPPQWKVAQAPYELANQQLTSTVYIKAVDRSGNQRISVFPPQRLFTGYEIVVFLAILTAVVLLLRARRGRRSKKNI